MIVISNKICNNDQISTLQIVQKIFSCSERVSISKFSLKHKNLNYF